MASYFINIDFTGYTFPINSISFIDLTTTNVDFTAHVDEPTTCNAIANYYISAYSGSSTVSSSGNVYTIELVLTNDPATSPTGQLCAIVIDDGIRAQFNYAVNQVQDCPDCPDVETTLCPECQDIELVNCGDVTFSIPLDDDTYTIRIEDHQSGMTYEQVIEFSGGFGDWNTTNSAGVFTPFSIYTLTVLDSSNQPVSWTVGATEYECATVTFKQFTDANVPS